MSVTESVFGRIFGGGRSVSFRRDLELNHSRNDLHTILKEERRRLVIRHLVADEDGESTTSDLADYVSMVQTGADSMREVSGDERKPVYVGLYQCHLPKLDKWGIIDYDQARGTVRALPPAYNLHEVIRALDRVSIAEDPS